MSERGGYGTGALAQVALAALVGGLLAVAVLATSHGIDSPRLLAVLVLAGVIFCVIAAAWMSSSSQPTKTAAMPLPDKPSFTWDRVTSGPSVAPGQHTEPTPAPPPRWRPPVPTPEPPPADPGAPPVSVAVPVQPDAWWQAAPGNANRAEHANARPAGADEAAVASLDLSDTKATTRVVQCPRCGDFGVDVGRQQPDFAFTCRHCGHQWRWGPGTAWPVSVVRPGVGRPAAGLRPRSS